LRRLSKTCIQVVEALVVVKNNNKINNNKNKNNKHDNEDYEDDAESRNKNNNSLDIILQKLATSAQRLNPGVSS
jgi:hypothetical protein